MRALLTHIANVLLKMALERGVRAALPRIYNILDKQMPQLLEQGQPKEVTTAVADAIQTATSGKVRVKQSQIDAILGLYSPVAGAAKKLLK
jgi:hypothetical protein